MMIEVLSHFPFPWMDKDEIELASSFDICKARIHWLRRDEGKADEDAD